MSVLKMIPIGRPLYQIGKSLEKSLLKIDIHILYLYTVVITLLPRYHG